MSRRASASSTPAPVHAQYESFADLVPAAPASPGPDTRRISIPQLFSRPSHASVPADREEAPPSKLSWRRYGSMGGLGGGAASDDDDEDGEGVHAQGREGWLSTWQLIGLTIGLAGAQLTWTVEMAFGTPYLLSLGLTKQSTSLVWLAGPLSGLLVQPIIGALSDSSSSRYRRRAFIVGSTFFVILSTLVVAYARAIAALLNSLRGLGDWDPSQEEQIKNSAIALAVVAFYFLDFSLNGLQASLRALILDRAPSSQQNIANAWHGRMTHLANIFGYLAGYINLGSLTAIDWIGGGQFRRLALLSCVVMIVCVTITCYTQEEVEREEHFDSSGRKKQVGLSKAFSNVKIALRELPEEVKRVCAVQFFAWSAWFPFLFYTTTWVAEIFYANVPPHTPKPTPDTATRAGSLALLVFAIVALGAGSLLPFLSTLGRRPFMQPYTTAATPVGRATRAVLTLMTPRNFWTVGLAMYGLLMIATFFTDTVGGAMVIIALLGVPWAVNCWVPFALVMEAIRDLDSSDVEPPSERLIDPPSTIDTKSFPPLGNQPFRAQVRSARQPSWGRSRATPPLANEHTSLVPSNDADTSMESGKGTSKTHPTGGTILGIHNLSIVMPQFFVALIAALIFKLLGHNDPSDPSDPNAGGGLKNGNNDVIWVLRFGGMMALLGAIVSRRLIKTGSELAYARFLEKGVNDSGSDQED